MVAIATATHVCDFVQRVQSIDENHLIYFLVTFHAPFFIESFRS